MSTAQGPVRVLLVEDNPGDARLIREYLCAEDGHAFAVAHVSTRAEAEAHLRRYPLTDVVLLDLSLPDSAGLETLHRVLAASPEIPVVVLTGTADERLPIEALRAGAQDYLPKEAASERVLLRVVRYAVERRRHQKEREEVYAALRESELRFHHLVETAHEGICILSTGGRLEYVNARMAEMLGYALEDAVGRSALEFVEECDRAAILERLARTDWHEEGGEVRLVRADGSVCWALGSSSPFRDDAGRHRGAYVVVTDITERKKAERRERLLADAGQILAASMDEKERLRGVARLVVPRLADWCVLDVVGDDGTLERAEVVAADPHKERLLQVMLARHPHHTSPGHHPVGGVLQTGRATLLRDISPGLLADIAEDPTHAELLQELAPVSSMVVPMVAHGRTVGAITLTVADPCRRFGDADLALAEELGRRTALAVQNVRLYAEARRARDFVTRLQQVTAALSEALTPEQVAEVVVHHGVEATGAASAALVLLNDAGTEFETLRAEGLSDEVRARWRRFPAGGPAPVCAAVRSREPLFFESEAELARAHPEFAATAGALLGGSTAVIPLLDRPRPAGALVFRYGEWRPLSGAERDLMRAIAHQSALALERSQLYERAQRAVRTRDEVLGVVAHDLRNPLGAISLYAHLAEDSLAEGERQSLRAIHGLVEQVDRLIQDLLDVSRLEAGQLRVDPQPVSPAELFDTAAAMFRPAATARHVTLATEMAGEPPPVMADRVRANQVLSNLIANALRFTPPEGRITLRAALQRAEVVFSVTDTGPGIAPEHLPFLFDRFWQAEKSSRAGAGLGLSIARGIVEAHQGRLWAESELGRGSTFSFSLPCAGEAEPGAGPTQPEPELYHAHPAPAEAHLRVVLVDDHPLVRHGIAQVLRNASPPVDVVGEASTGEEAVEIALRLHPDVVLMDVEMPGMGGLAATRRIHEMDRRIQVIALTADAQEDVLIPVLRAGGSGFVRKSEAHHDLVPAMRAAARHEAVLPPGGVDLLIAGYHPDESADAPDPLAGLSPQDREILCMAAEGFTSREIGKKLFLSPYTVDSYRSELMRRLGLAHRPDLVKFAVRTGLLAEE